MSLALRASLECGWRRTRYLLSTAIAGDTVLRPELAEWLTPMSFFHSAVERQRDRDALAGRCAITELVPCAFSQVPRMMRDHIGIDALTTQVSPMDEHGEFSFGISTGYALQASRYAQRVILEVNRHMPRVTGNCTVPLSRVTALVEHDQRLLEIPSGRANSADEAIAETIAGLVDDGACLQMGIGALPETTCTALRHHRHLGIHTELITPGLVKLMQDGNVDNSRKAIHPGRSVFTFAMGDRAFYDYLNDNEALEAHPVDYVNDPSIIARNPKVLSINATLAIDLQGACNSEAMKGRQYSGSGGQLDFVRVAYLSPGGRSIIACHSTAANGTVSRIVPRLSGPVTTPRNDVHIVVTEYGSADLKGLSLKERARALIPIAHPHFREDLLRSIKDYE